MCPATANDAEPTYTHFAHRVEFLTRLEQFLALDVSRAPSEREDENEEKLAKALGAVLDYYLPLPGLLDPSLDEILSPLMQLLSTHLTRLANHDGTVNPARLARFGRLVNWVVKVRGWKSVVPHFPSSILYLPMLIILLSPPTTSSCTSVTLQHPIIASQDAWELRAVLLLWLALLLTVPFNLSALSSFTSTRAYDADLPAREKLFSTSTSDIARRVTLLSLPLLRRQGKEGAYSALVLARLFSRSDVVPGLPGFLDWAGAEVLETEREGEANLVASVLEFMAVLPTMLSPTHLDVLSRFMDEVLLPHLRGSRTATSGLIRKLAVKAKGRWWIARMGSGHRDGPDAELTEGLEEELDDLMSGLGDKDTIVRYSSAKYLARLSALLPAAFSDQIVFATISLFSGTEDERIIETSFGTIVDPGGSSTGGVMGFGGLETTRGEARWHGVCLALAEMARRGVVRDEAIGQAVGWVLKALTFDLRRASHSIGANVRDAASYLLWSLSRACQPKALVGYAKEIATSLICVACFDREVGVRRAASAAFQEGVGRLGLYPEGIDVLGKTDFYSVSVRRMAFTVAAPSVAVHRIYRDRMREHLHHITLRHWDISMRHSAAVALRRILELGDPTDIEHSMQREIVQLPSLDATNVHGGLVSLIQIAKMPNSSTERHQKIISAFSTIRPAAFVSQLASDLLQSACNLITACLSATTVQAEDTRKLLDQYLDLAMRRREPECQEAVAKTYGRLSELRDCTEEVKRLITELKSIRVPVRQCAALSLGHIRFAVCTSPAEKSINALLGQLKSEAKADVETRRYAIQSLASIACQTNDDGALHAKSPIFQAIIEVFVLALADYSTDQRGDVGSWIRIAGLEALGRTIAIIGTCDPSLVSQEVFEAIIGGIVKQAVEKLEPVREAAALALARLRAVEASLSWDWEGCDALVFIPGIDGDNTFRYTDQEEWFLSAAPLIGSRYRSWILGGLVLSIGSQMASISTLAFRSLLHYLESLAGDISSTMAEILEDLLGFLTANLNQNRVFIPTLVTITKLFGEGEHFEWHRSAFSAQVQDMTVRIIQVACREIPPMRSIERITAAMKLLMSALTLPFPSVRGAALDALPMFLAHRFPRTRAMTAEHLYLTLSAIEDEMEPDLEDVLLETSWTDEGVGEAEAERVIRKLASHQSQDVV